MKFRSQDQQTMSSPVLDGFQIADSPFLGFGLLLTSVIGSLAILIYFGAWASSDRITDRATEAGITKSSVEAEWWEKGLLLTCPLH